MNEWIGSNRKGLAIVRVSSHRQRDNISHDAQEAEIRSYCLKNGIELIEVVRMVESAKDSDNRKHYTAAVNRALADEIQHLLFYMYDREARNLTDNERNEKLVKAGLICLHYVRDNKVLHRTSSDSDFFIRDVQAAANKQYSRALSAKVLDAMRQKAEQGWYPGNWPPLGYTNERLKDEHGKLLKSGSRVIVDPNERNVKQVQREFELRALGFSFRAIRDQIVKEGLVSEHRIKAYSHAIIENRLKNDFYKGVFHWQGTEYEGKHPLIIPATTLARVRGSFSGKRFSLKRIDEHAIFSNGWMKCALCGCHVVYDPKKRKYKNGNQTIFHYYHCTNGKREHVSMAGMNILDFEIWEQLTEAVDSITLGPTQAKEIAKALNASEERARTQSGVQIEAMKEQMRLIEAREEKLYDDLSSGILDQVAYIRIAKKLREERKNQASQLENLQAVMRGKRLATAQSTLELASHAKSLFLSRSAWDRMELLNLILSNPRLKGRTVEYDLRKSFSILRQMRDSGNWLALLDDYRTSCVQVG